ncbi:MAG: prepilin-type N-terminal cleavage/methylation domain-containing protein [Planctomycetaceae bacterium]
MKSVQQSAFSSQPSRQAFVAPSPPRPLAPSLAQRRGFTLVELLVAVALIVLIMSMFAQVFRTASNLITRQKGMAENGQRARTLTTIIRGDIARRTFRDVVPFARGTFANPGTGSPIVFNAGRRSGFFSVSENDPDNDADDVLHLTIQTSADPDIPDQPPLEGAATLLRLGAPPPSDVDYLRDNSNQPEMDDGQVDIAGGAITGLVNFRGSSTAGEVVYFLRNGNLYRRALLIREPYNDPAPPSNQPDDAVSSRFLTGRGPDLQPGVAGTDDDGANGTDDPGELGWPGSDDGYSIAVAPLGSGLFWRDFDFSAFYDDPSGAGAGPTFHHASSSLSNTDAPSVSTGGGFPFSLGIPHLRYGHTLSLAGVPGLAGAPVEYIVGPDGQPGDATVDDDGANGVDDFGELGFAGTDDQYIGRFTIHETAHSAFIYPGNAVSNAVSVQDPHVNTALQLGPDGLVAAYSDEPARQGEDIILSNVHSFDIKVWDDDPAEQAFVDLGSGAGRYQATANTAYGNRYDTWHLYLTANLPAGANLPPYPPLTRGPDGQPGAALIDDDANGVDDDAGELGWLGTDDEILLRAIQITIRFYDVSSNQMKQLTLQMSLLN